ncbi:hypothetical protein C2U72_16815, partial [Prosthecomicrobium hirschii]|uniref:hypothetical protein n=1 Tax=Prosthecodimorpha hirschii TaxID=665126 RepID=UPI001AED2810
SAMAKSLESLGPRNKPGEDRGETARVRSRSDAFFSNQLEHFLFDWMESSNREMLQIQCLEPLLFGEIVSI